MSIAQSKYPSQQEFKAKVLAGRRDTTEKCNLKVTTMLWSAMLFMLTTLTAAYAAPSDRQLALLTNNCMQCHARPGIGVPLAGDAAAWKERAAQGEERMLLNVVHGLRGLPPLGYCSACSEDDFRVLIRLMAGLPEATAGKAK